MSDGREAVNVTASVWQVGDVKITRVVEVEFTGPIFLLPDATKENILKMPWLQPHFATRKGNCRISVHSFVIETPAKRILVDTGLGNDKERHIPLWSHLQGGFLKDLEAAGYPTDQIDAVLCTHLHTDHVGWNTVLVDEEWVPTFESAEYLFGREEWSYTQQQIGRPEFDEFIVDSVSPIIDRGLVRFVATDERICDEVYLEPTPGHTPGHASVRIESKGEQAVITGDSIHHPCQMQEQTWECPADWNREIAEATRKNMLGEYADANVLVFGTHFASPSAGRVKHEKDHFILVV